MIHDTPKKPCPPAASAKDLKGERKQLLQTDLLRKLLSPYLFFRSVDPSIVSNFALTDNQRQKNTSSAMDFRGAFDVL